MKRLNIFITIFVFFVMGNFFVFAENNKVNEILEFKILCDEGDQGCVKSLQDEKNPIILIEDIKSVSLRINNEEMPNEIKTAFEKEGLKLLPPSDVPDIDIVFQETGKQKIAELTKRNIGRLLGFFVDGKLISSPGIYEAMEGSKISITGKFTKEEAQVLVDKINEVVRK